MADLLLTVLRTLNRTIAILIGIGLLAGAVFVLLDILLRQFGASFGGTDEISGYVMAITAAWGMSFTLLELGHVRIDLLRSRSLPKARVLFDFLSMLVLAVTITVAAFQCWPVLEKSLNNNSRANTVLETPLWWVQVPWFAGWIWFAVVSWVTLLAAMMLFAQGRFDDTERAIGVITNNDNSP